MFDNDKKVILEKKDKSKIGKVDAKIKKLVDKINSKKDFFTTSSCSGRILLISQAISGKKNEARWIFSSHEKIKANDIIKINEFPKELVYFKMEPVILHVCCRTLDDAKLLLDVFSKSGFRRYGIFSIKKDKIMVELMGSDKLDIPFSVNKERLVSDEYIKFAVEIANKKLDKTHEKIKVLEKNVSKLV
jgi:tRNA wybutosine-synthesizing protein 3